MSDNFTPLDVQKISGKNNVFNTILLSVLIIITLILIVSLFILVQRKMRQPLNSLPAVVPTGLPSPTMVPEPTLVIPVSPTP